MKNIRIEPTDRSPMVDFAFDAGRLVLRGESYPENAAAFFGPLQQAVQVYLAASGDGGGGGGAVLCEVELSYFNSSSAKALMNLFSLLEDAAAKGRAVTIRWRFPKDDDTMEELGEDFAEDMRYARFEFSRIDG